MGETRAVHFPQEFLRPSGNPPLLARIGDVCTKQCCRLSRHTSQVVHAHRSPRQPTAFELADRPVSLAAGFFIHQNSGRDRQWNCIGLVGMGSDGKHELRSIPSAAIEPLLHALSQLPGQLSKPPHAAAIE